MKIRHGTALHLHFAPADSRALTRYAGQKILVIAKPVFRRLHRQQADIVVKTHNGPSPAARAVLHKADKIMPPLKRGVLHTASGIAIPERYAQHSAFSRFPVNLRG